MQMDSHLFNCLMLVLVYEHLKRADTFNDMQIIQWGCESDAYVGSSLVEMYSKCRSIEDAWRVFKRMPECNVVAWSAMSFGTCEVWPRPEGIGIISSNAAARGDPVTFVGVLIACARVAALEDSRHVHEEFV